MKSIKYFAIVLAFAEPTSLKCQTSTLNENAEIKKPNCSETISIATLCSSVSDRRQDTRDDSPYEYEFEERINKLACVDVNKDSPEVINKKIHDFWVKNEKDLICDGASFNVPKGNILKLAAYKSFSQFLDKAVHDWKVPLNKVDPTDGRTTLDYIKDELSRNKGQPNEKSLQNYYDVLKKAGAKHKFELSQEYYNQHNNEFRDHKNCVDFAPCKKRH